MNQLFLHCRPGFEKEAAAEITEIAAGLGVYGYCKLKDQEAYVIFHVQEEKGLEQLVRQIPFTDLIFIRQWFITAGLIEDLPITDRVSPLCEVAAHLPRFAELIVETPDTNEAKTLLVLGKKITSPLVNALRKKMLVDQKSSWNLHLVFITGTSAYLGVSLKRNSSSWPMGIPRLKLPKEAPSRATLKLEEAWHHFIPEEEWDDRLAGSMKSVDLGAAPGGWTWQLVNRGMYVDAIDNGPMAKNLMETGQVNHILMDGFIYEPKKPVDWLVCDIVDKPARVASMITRWFSKGNCREAIFNLKLPMKQRYAEVKKCELKIVEDLADQGIQVSLRFKQLYHDREEVTGHIYVVKKQK